MNNWHRIMLYTSECVISHFKFCSSLIQSYKFSTPVVEFEKLKCDGGGSRRWPGVALWRYSAGVVPVQLLYVFLYLIVIDVRFLYLIETDVRFLYLIEIDIHFHVFLAMSTLYLLL